MLTYRILLLLFIELHPSSAAKCNVTLSVNVQCNLFLGGFLLGGWVRKEAESVMG